MKKIGFIGVYDKTDLLLNLAKILTTMKYKVLNTMHTMTLLINAILISFAIVGAASRQKWK